MAERQQNIIHDASIHFWLNGLERDALGKNDFVAWARTHILEVLDEHATRLSEAGMMIKIPELKIDLHLNVDKNIFAEGEQLRKSIAEQIEAALKKVIQKNKNDQISEATYRAGIVLGYLESGQLSQGVTNEVWDQLISDFYNELSTNKMLEVQWAQTIKNKDAFIRFFRLKTVVAQKEFVQQYTQENNVVQRLTAILKLFNANPDYFLSIQLIDFYFTLFQLLPTTNWSLKTTMKMIIRQQMIPKKIAFQSLTVPKAILEEVKEALVWDPEKDIPDATKKAEVDLKLVKEHPTTENHFEETDAKGTHIGQAGLVLLANFLPLFLKHAGFIDSKGRLLNVLEIPMLLHYIATGETEAQEWKLTLPKIMAGLNPGQHCNTAIKPTKKLKKQIIELLQAVIGHWEALKNTSPDGLRETFLKREGILKVKNGYYYLYITEQTVDILLTYVPWNYSTIKLQWMQKILFVEWNKN